MGEAIVITSGKGGVVQTTTTVYVGTAIELIDNKICLVDIDIVFRNIVVVMGLENRIIFDIVDVIEGCCKLEQALIQNKRFDQLVLLPAAQTTDKSAVTKEGMQDIISELKQDYDYIIID